MLQIYYGNGKGKTTACIGSAIRAAGQDFKVLFIQFFKDGSSGEVKILKNINNIDYRNASSDYRLFEEPTQERKDEFYSSCTDAIVFAQSNNDNYNMIILDEVIDAFALNYIDQKILTDFLCNNKDKTEIIISGHSLPKELEKSADYISEIKAIKHPYEKGIKARKGIEF